MQRRVVVLIAAAIVVLAGAAVVSAAAIPGLLHTTQRSDQPASTINTAPQKSAGNAGAFVDVTDNPVALPVEKQIYPPRTGSAGLAVEREGRTASPFALLATGLVLLTGARLATRGPRPK